tara:strand:+ start:34219 stop:34716 length:498 start_codon:yes stop_codon:yes gene_type:complete
MNVGGRKRIAAQLLKCGENRVWFDPKRLSEVKEAITKSDIRALIRDLAVQKKPELGSSRVRARKRLMQKRKGRQQGAGSRKGKRTARLPRKRAWINRIRPQRDVLKKLNDSGLISPATYRLLYKKAKGGFFRSRRHIKLYLEEHKLIKQNEKKTKKPSVQKKKGR